MTTRPSNRALSRSFSLPYSPKCLEGEFPEVRQKSCKYHSFGGCALIEGDIRCSLLEESPQKKKEERPCSQSRRSPRWRRKFLTARLRSWSPRQANPSKLRWRPSFRPKPVGSLGI